jgi:ATP-dependent protease ClpP protease subunit
MNEERKSFVRKLLDIGIVLVTDSINEETLRIISDAVSEFYIKKIPKMTLLISSDGGNLSIALQIYDLLGLYPGEKTGIVFGRAHSAALIVLQGCDKRYATANSTILIHHGSCNVNKNLFYDKKGLAKLIRDAKEVEKVVSLLFQKKTKRTPKEIHKLSMEDKKIFVKEAIKFGFLDGVWDKPLPFVS